MHRLGTQLNGFARSYPTRWWLVFVVTTKTLGVTRRKVKDGENPLFHEEMYSILNMTTG